MRKSHAHMAAVVDEFGGTDGLATVEDLVVELLGELHDEHRGQEPAQLVRRADGKLEADARVDIDDLEKLFNCQLLTEDERDEVDTLGGLIVTMADRIPNVGEEVRHPAGLAFEILDADPRRIKRVLIDTVPTDRAGRRRRSGASGHAGDDAEDSQRREPGEAD
jgi:CBS domain containing-hemolysin-like protein